MRQHKQTAQGKIKTSDFQPPWWARNRHLQTLWPRFLMAKKVLNYTTERLELADGDFVDLAWGEKPAKPRGLAVIFHGLEGSIKSHYANHTLASLQQNNWQVVLMHFRGCSGEPNRLAKSYHSGDTEDARYLLSYLHQRYSHLPMVAVGFSLGGNMLLKLLGEEPKQPWLTAAVSISAPLRLDECASSINKGFSRLYQHYLLSSMCRTVKAKMANIQYPKTLQLCEQKLAKLKSFCQFDQCITAPLHGFANAYDYYRRASAIDYLKHILTPTLILHAADDPFMNSKVIPQAHMLAPAVNMEISQYGGHVGFLQGKPWQPSIWYLSRLHSYFKGLGL